MEPLPRERPSRRRRFHVAAATAAAAVGLAGLATAFGQGTPSVYQVPSTIPSDCSVDVTQPLLDWSATVPDGSTLSFTSQGCYRIEGTLEFRGRSGLTFEGNGATFQSFTPPADQRPVWRVIDSTNIVFRDMTVKGSYTNGGTFDAGFQHAHAIDVRGTSVEIANVTMTDVAGDCVYLGLGYSPALNRSSGSVHDSICLRTGRNAVSVTAGDNILVQHVTTGQIGYTTFDVEPNAGAGWGAQNVTFDSNTIGSYYLYAYSVVENAPTSDESFTNNHISGQGLRIGVVHPSADYRPSNVKITGNTSDTAQWSPAMEIQTVDGLTVTGNTVPMSGGAMATVVGSCGVDVTGNTYTGGSAQLKTTPWVCSVAPGSGTVGSGVTLSGSGFTGATAVSFNGVNARFSVDSDAQITTTVPSGATSGTMSVTTPAGTATSSLPFAIISSAPAPTTPGTTTVTVTGSGLIDASGAEPGSVPASVTGTSDAQATAIVPTAATTAAISVTTPGGTASASTSTSSTATTPSTASPAVQAPSINSFTPSSGAPGTSVTVRGANLAGAIAVTIAGVPASFTVDSATRLRFTVPRAAIPGASGAISVTTPGGTAKTAKRFRVTKH